MAYPFCPATTWGKFLSDLAQKGIAVVVEDGVEVPNEDGEMCALRYLEGPGSNGTPMQVPVIYDSLVDFVAPTVIRSTCAAYGIDPGLFGFILG